MNLMMIAGLITFAVINLSFIICGEFMSIYDFQNIKTNSLGYEIKYKEMEKFVQNNNIWLEVIPKYYYDSYVYSDLTRCISKNNCPCFTLDTQKYKYLRIYAYWFMQNSASFYIEFRYNSANSADCSRIDDNYDWGVQVNNWQKDPETGFEVGQIDLTSYQSLVKNRITRIYLSYFSPLKKSLAFRSIGLYSDCFAVCPGSTNCGLSQGRGKCNCDRKTCSCNAGFRGSDCECKTCPSGCNAATGKGICNCDGTCTCNAGFGGSDCSCKTCPSNCNGRGTCNCNGTCSCARDYQGSADCLCKTKVSGSCLNGPNTYNCETGNCNCFDGWGGALCDCKISCSPICKNGGSCLCSGSCSCPAEWKGSLDCACRTPVTIGTDLKCSSLGWTGSYLCNNGTCACKPGWTGDLCDCPTSPTACPNPCKNGGTCVCGLCQCPLEWRGSSDCSCRTPVGGPTCNTNNQPIPNQRNCSTGLCICSQGWTGPLCDCRICPNNCTNRGICKCDGVCSCPSDYLGSLDCSCKTPEMTRLCVNPRDLPAQYDCASGKCICKDGWTGDFCDCKSTCPGNCNGNGICNCGTCNCSSGYKGSADCKCATPKYLDVGSNSNKTGCINWDGTFNCETGNCNCLPGWSGPICDCKDNLPCLNNCSGRGVCKCGVCSCPESWKRALDCSCKDPIGGKNVSNCFYDCATGTCSASSCNNSSLTSSSSSTTTSANISCPLSCIQSNGSIGCHCNGTCRCLAGFSGTNCECKSCEFPCQNGGKCDCRTGTCNCSSSNFTGSYCERVLCNKDCLNSIGCRADGSCICQTGYAGALCQNKTCPVDELGDCNAANGGYCNADGTCSCPPGYLPPDCKCIECSQSCKSSPNSISSCDCNGQCICKPFYYGLSCDYRNCSEPCSNGGTCSNDGVCVCAMGYSGTFCDICDVDCQLDTRSSSIYDIRTDDPNSPTKTVSAASVTAIFATTTVKSRATPETLVITNFTELFINNFGLDQGGTKLTEYKKATTGGAEFSAEAETDWYTTLFDRYSYSSTGPFSIVGRFTFVRFEALSAQKNSISLTFFVASADGRVEEYFRVSRWTTVGTRDIAEVRISDLKLVDPERISLMGFFQISPIQTRFTILSISLDYYSVIQKAAAHSSVITKSESESLTSQSSSSDQEGISIVSIVVATGIAICCLLSGAGAVLYLRSRSNGAIRGNWDIFRGWRKERIRINTNSLIKSSKLGHTDSRTNLFDPQNLEMIEPNRQLRFNKSNIPPTSTITPIMSNVRAKGFNFHSPVHSNNNGGSSNEAYNEWQEALNNRLDKSLTVTNYIDNTVTHTVNFNQQRRGVSLYIENGGSAKVVAGTRTTKIDDNNVTLMIDQTDQQRSEIFIPGYLCLVKDHDFSFDLKEGSSISKGGSGAIITGTLYRQDLVKKMQGETKVAIKIMLKNGSVLQINEDEIDHSNVGDGTRKKQDPHVVDFFYEVALMASLPGSPHLIKFVGYSLEPVSIIMKQYTTSIGLVLRRQLGSVSSGDNLNFYLDQVMTPRKALKIAKDVATGMATLHQNGIIHLDLKPDNILIDGDFDKDDPLNFNCVICDFGFSSIVNRSRSLVSGLSGPKRVGLTSSYAAPELYAEIKSRMKSENGRFDREEDKKLDIYAFAITMYEILALSPAWRGVPKDQIRKKVCLGDRPTIPPHFEKRFPAISLLCIENGWQQDPTKRPSFETLVTQLKAVNNAAEDSLSVTQMFSKFPPPSSITQP